MWEEQEAKVPTVEELQDDRTVTSDIHQPLALINWEQIKNSISVRTNTELNPQADQNILERKPKCEDTALVGHNVAEQLGKDETLRNIFKRTREQPKTQPNLEQTRESQTCEPSFLYECQTWKKVVYHQTPRFRNALQSPFPKFNLQFKKSIEGLAHTQFDSGDLSKILELQCNPFQYIERPAGFFTGIANMFRKQKLVSQALFFYKLSCYVEPYHWAAWEKYMDMLNTYGRFRQALIISKTAFLFCPSAEMACQYFKNGDKCQAPTHQLRSMLCCLKHPKNHQKIILQCAKYEAKYRKPERSIWLLLQFMIMLDFKSNLAPIMILLAKLLEAYIGKGIAVQFLKRAIDKKTTKYEAFSLYLEYLIQMRRTNQIDAHTLFSELDELLARLINIKGNKNITEETKYKFQLEIAEAIFREGPALIQSYRNIIERAWISAETGCKVDSAKDRAKKQIFYSVLSTMIHEPSHRMIQETQKKDHLLFLKNRHTFIIEYPQRRMMREQFCDWKYYLHYALEKDYKTMIQASSKWPQSGRLMAEWIHVLRTMKRPLPMLKLWRKKIQQIPKSGELWCEGGRIYADLKQYSNASKCFLTAICLTPQFGDSFFQQLKILLMQGRFYDAEQLRKNFIISEPFIGNALSFVRNQGEGLTTYKLSLGEIWQKACLQIRQNLYSDPYNQKRMLTAIPTYNTAFLNPRTGQIRQKLFISYQQMENKNSKN